MANTTLLVVAAIIGIGAVAYYGYTKGWFGTLGIPAPQAAGLLDRQDMPAYSVR